MTGNLTKLIAKSESATLELKRSTCELREAMQTLCTFANGKGGRVVIGVKPSGVVATRRGSVSNPDEGSPQPAADDVDLSDEAEASDEDAAA